ncbi:MAG: UvrB/UvrC motif-containing protein [Sarcina sp.]
MLCEKCNKNIATISIVKIINGNREQMMVCEQCASRLIDKPISNFKDLDGEEFKKLLSTLMDPSSDNNKNIDLSKLKCPICNISYKDFKEKNMLGCNKCYEIFYDSLKEENMVSNKIYKGKFPTKYGIDILQKRKMKLLQEELNVAISTENYEHAAVLRDEINKLSNDLEGEIIDE